MIWLILAWLYLTGMGLTYALDANSYTLFWFTVVILLLWPVWVTLIGLWWCGMALRDLIADKPDEELTND
jgi:hypothetical protein